MRLPRLGERPGHSATTAHFQAVYPFLGEGSLGAPGVYVGRDAYGGAWLYDPWALYKRSALAGPNMVVVGQIGFAKSSLIKTYIYRQRVFGRVAWVIDPKSEYAPLAEAMGGAVIALRPGGEVRLNPLSSRGGREGQLSLLRSVTGAALRRELASEEDAGLRVALDRVNEQSPNGEPTLPQIVAALLSPQEEMAQELRTDVAALAEGRARRRLACSASARATYGACSTAPRRRASTSRRRWS